MDVEQFFSERRFSKIVDEFPDKNLYPLYYTAHKSEITIGPGEGIFIPAGWFHFVFSSGDMNKALNFWHVAKQFEEGLRTKDTPIKFRHDIKELELDENTEVEVSQSTTNIVGTRSIKSRCKDTLVQEVTKPLKQFYEEKDPHSYVVQSRQFPHLDKYRIDKESEFKGSTVWLNFGNIRTLLHYDLDDNYLCQVEGTKRILLFPPEDRDLLYLWNSYSLEVINALEIMFYNSDEIHTFLKFISNEDCTRFIEQGLTQEDNQIMVEKYYDKLHGYHEKMGTDVPVHIGVPTFRVVKSSEISKVNVFPQFAHLIVFLEPTLFRHKCAKLHPGPGAMAIFPNTFSFKWWIDECYILVPTIIEEEVQQSMSQANTELPE